jgi:hypothetical protein
MSYLITVVVIALVIGTIWRSSQAGKPIERGPEKIFPPSAVLRFVLLIGALMFAALAIGFSVNLPWKNGWWLDLCFVGLLALEVISWPPSIIVDQTCLRTAGGLRRSKVIPWNAIAEIIYDPVKDLTTIVGENGVTIVA